MNQSTPPSGTIEYALEQAVARLDADKDRLDAFMVHIKWIVSVVSSIVLIVVGFVSFLGVSNLNEITNQLSQNAKSYVRIAIDQENGNMSAIESLSERLQSAQVDYESHRAAIDSLALLAELEAVDRQDPHYAFSRLRELDTQEMTPENRGAALKLLANIIDAGVQGIADPNLLFNTAVLAENLGFYLEAAKVAVLAEFWRPSPSHRAVSAQTAETLGQRFELVEGSLRAKNTPPNEVRTLAWSDLLNMVADAPRVEGEHIYSRAWNVAHRNQSVGYFDEVIDAILESEKMHPNRLTSYAYATLAQIYIYQASEDWNAKSQAAMLKAIELLEEESPMATWYNSTLKTLSELSVGVEDRAAQ